MLRFGAVKILTVKEVFDTSTVEGQEHFKTRTASLQVAKQEIREGVIEVEAERTVLAVRPGHTYVVTSGLHGDVANENGDFFPWTELLKRKADGKYMFETWVGCPVLLNHDMSKRVGTIIDAFPIKDEKSIDFLLEIEDKLAPHVAQGLRRGEVSGTSMGVLVGQSICNICENLAHDESEWCNHLSPKGLNLKGRVYLGQDGGKHREKIGQKVEEINMVLEGVEDSLITFGEPADPEALIKRVLASKKEEETMGLAGKPERESSHKGTLRSVDELKRQDISSGGGAMPVVNTSDIAAQMRQSAQYREIPGASVPANSPVAKFVSVEQVLEDIKSGKLSKASAVEAVDTFRLATARQLEDMTPKQAIALLEEEVSTNSEEDAMKVQAQAEVAVVGGPDKNPSKLTPSGNQAKELKDKEENQPSPKQENIVKPGTPNGTQANEVKDKEEDQPTPQGSVSKTNADCGKQADETNKSKVEAVLKQLEELTKIVAQLKKADACACGNGMTNDQIPATPKGDQASEVNSTKPEETKPAPKKVPLNSGTPNGKQNAEVNSTKPEENQPKPKTAEKVVKAEGEERETPAEEKKEEKSEPKVEEKKEDVAVEQAEVGQISEALSLIDQLKAVLEGNEEVEEAEIAGAPAPVGVGVAEVAAAPIAPPVPDMMYAAKLIKDEKSPVDSYYVVSHKNKPVFMISCRQAFQEGAEKEVGSFTSDEYRDTLVSELKKCGAKKVFKELFASMGVVQAQLEAGPDKAPQGAADMLPEETEAPAGPATIEGDALKDMATDDPKVSELSTNLLDFLTVFIGSDKAAEPRQVLEDLVKVVAGEGAAVNENFAGKLEKAVGDKKTEEAVEGAPDAYKPEAGAEAAPAPAMPSKPSEVMAALKKATAKLATVKANLPVITSEIESLRKQIAEKDELIKKYEYETYIKARQTVTVKVAKQKAQLGLIKSEDTKAEAVRLAKLEDSDFVKEVEMLENSIKIAQKLGETKDYKNTEGEGTPRFASVVPSPFENTASASEDDGLVFSKAKSK